MNVSTMDLSSTPSFNASLFHNPSENATNMTDPVQTMAPSGGGRLIPWDNPENIMTKELSDDITYCLQCIVFPIFTIFGLIGTTLSLVVLFQKKLRNSTTSIVLIGLAISDFCFLVTNMARKSTCIIRQFDKLMADTFNAVSFGGLFYTKTAFSRVSTLLVVLISIERMIAVAFPLKVRSLVTKSRMIAAVVMCYIIPFAFAAGLPPQYTYTFIQGRPYIAQTKFAKDNADTLKIYNEYFLVITLRYIPVILVIIFNTVIIVLFKQGRKFQQKSTVMTDRDSARLQEQRKLTRMLLSVALVFLVCLLPGDIVLLISGINTKFSFFGTYHNFFLVISDVSLLFEIINSSINFIIYMLLNKLFYGTCKSLFSKCCKGRNILPKKSATTTKSSETKSTLTGENESQVKCKDIKVESKDDEGEKVKDKDVQGEKEVENSNEKGKVGDEILEKC